MNLIPTFLAAVLASSPPSAEATQAPAARHELGFQWVAAQYNDDEGTTFRGPGARLHLLERFGAHLALGAEATWYGRVGGYTSVDQNEYHTVHYKPLFQAGVVGRAGMDRGPVRPSLLLGCSWYHARDDNPVLPWAGVEVELRLGERLALVVDARHHVFMVSAGLGARLLW